MNLFANTTRRRRILRVLLAALLALLLFAGLVALWGTTASVMPPASPDDPVTVMLIADELHRGLLLPDGAGGFVEFGFGDWEYYARGDDGCCGTIAALFWPTPGTLSRRMLPLLDPAGVRAALPWARFQELRVGRTAARALCERLDAACVAQRGRQVARPNWNMTFVPWPRRFWVLDNCGDAVADWLRELGCSVSWVPICLDLRVE